MIPFLLWGKGGVHRQFREHRCSVLQHEITKQPGTII